MSTPPNVVETWPPRKSSVLILRSTPPKTAFSFSAPSSATVGLLGIPTHGGANRLHSINRPAPISTSGQKLAHVRLRKPSESARNRPPIPTRTPPVSRPLEVGESTIFTSPTAIRIAGQSGQTSCMKTMFRLLSRNNTPMPITPNAGRMPGTELLPRQSSCSCMSSAYGGGAHESSPNRRTPQFYRRVRTVWRVTIAAPSPPATGVSSRSRAAVARLIGEMHNLRPAADGPGDVVFDGEDEFPAQCPRFGQNGGERGVEQVDAPIAASAGRVRDQAKIVHQYQAVTLDGVFDHAEECLLDGRRSLRLARVHELPCAQKHPSPGGLHGLQNRGFAGARRAAEYCHRAHPGVGP